MGGSDWQWWKEFEATGPGAPRSSWQEAWRHPAVRWVVLAGGLVLAAFKFADGAWMFGLAYAACAIGLFVGYTLEARRRARGHPPGG